MEKYKDPSHLAAYFFSRHKNVFRFNKKVEITFALLHELEIWPQSSMKLYKRLTDRNGPVISYNQFRKIINTLSKNNLIKGKLGKGFYKDPVRKFISLKELLEALDYTIEHVDLPKTKVDFLQKMLYDFLYSSGIRMRTEIDILLGLTSRAAVKTRKLTKKQKIDENN